MLDLVQKRGLLPAVEWDVVVDSSVVKLQKPEEAIFREAEERAGVEPTEILFVENSRGHLVTLEKRGWQTYWFDSCDYAAVNQGLADRLGLRNEIV